MEYSDRVRLRTGRDAGEAERRARHLDWIDPDTGAPAEARRTSRITESAARTSSRQTASSTCLHQPCRASDSSRIDRKPYKAAAVIRPDYAGGSIVDLMRTLGDACGAQPALPYAPLHNLKVSLLGTARNIVLLVIDGLGYDYLLRHGAGGALHRHLHSRLTLGLSSTTASAVTTYTGGLRAPNGAALTGCACIFSELDAIAAVLPLRPRGLGFFDALPGCRSSCSAIAPFVDRIARRTAIVSPQSIAGSTSNLCHLPAAPQSRLQDPTKLFGQVGKQDCARSTAPALPPYAYYAELDTLAHIHGVGSDQLAAQIALLPTRLPGFLAAIADTDTVVLACADHGFIDSPPERQIELLNTRLRRDARAPKLAASGGVVYCYVRPDKESSPFVDYVQDVLGECADLFSGSELIAQGWFGPGEADRSAWPRASWGLRADAEN
ncbi:MAG: alkaline phosphatase family protein [Rhodocyclaceae bacterium]|nr:alkaline phosphatase family protein [Rhodocyclaceae bacterium]